MCGIAGFYNATVDTGTIRSIIGRLLHRGPDDQQFYIKDDIGLIHTRLTIIELSKLGSQPYKFGELVLVYNGELYNYKEVRMELELIGYSFQSNSDTEVLIKAFHRWGEKCANKFIGMFAFAIYNIRTNEMYLFRDRVGVKPLYYRIENKSLYFASELAALLEFGVPREVDIDAVSLYFRFGFVPGNLSIYKGTFKLEPGHYLKISSNEISKHRYWELNYSAGSPRKESEWIDELESLLISSFRYRMVSDVPVGVFLSGGIDSSLLTAILQKHHGGIHSFTIGFKETEFDESKFAVEVAKYLQTTHTGKELGIEEASQVLNMFYNIYDEPFADTSGIPTSSVTKLAKENGVKVVLSADGGDELFGGYTHYQKALALFNTFAKLPMNVRHTLSKTSRLMFPRTLRKRISPLNIEHKSYALEELAVADTPIKFFEAFLANQSMDEISNMISTVSKATLPIGSDFQDNLQAMMAWDFHYYLPDDLLVKVDRATMFHSVECREPFLDHRLVEFAMRIPTAIKVKHGDGKYPLKNILSRYIPPAYFERKKQGFSIPIFSWFARELDVLFDRYLSTEKLEKVYFLDTSEVQREHKKYLYNKKKGRQYNIEKMWRILSFMMWWEKYVERES